MNSSKGGPTHSAIARKTRNLLELSFLQNERAHAASFRPTGEISSLKGRDFSLPLEMTRKKRFALFQIIGSKQTFFHFAKGSIMRRFLLVVLDEMSSGAVSATLERIQCA